jgi:hypothetical protein
VAAEGSTKCSDCPAGEVPAPDKSACVTCPDGEYASGGVCVKEASTNDNAVEGMLSNSGAPFFIMGILVVVLGALGFAVYSSKKGVADVHLLPDKEHVIQFMVNSGGFISEMILGISVVGSGVQQILGYGIMLLASRLLIGVTPGVMVFASIFSGDDIDLEDKETGEKVLKYYINSDVIMANSKLYVAVLSLSIVEPTLVVYLPWYDTEMSRIARFPTMKFMKIVYCFEFAQMLMTLVAQIGITVMTQGNDGTFGIVVIMNVVFSGLMLCSKGFYMFLNWGLLRGASKDEDSEAMRKRWKKMQRDRTRKTEGLELGAVYDGENEEDENATDGIPARNSYISNPLLLNIAAASSVSSQEHERLLARFRVVDDRMEAMVEEMQTIESRTENLEKRQDKFESRNINVL